LRLLYQSPVGVVPQLSTSQPARLAVAAAALLVAWFAMQAVHECGHVLAAWLTGGTVQRVVLHPLSISRTDVSPNPHPLAVAWAGPIFGAAAPLALRRRWRCLRRANISAIVSQRFFDSLQASA
jgi:hypothetical protein